MSIKEYITAEQCSKLSFSYDLKQSWLRDPMSRRTISREQIVGNFRKLAEDDQIMVLELVSHLHKFVFSTKEQIEAVFSFKSLDNTRLATAFDYCLSSNIINMFTVARFQLQDIPEDAAKIYCVSQSAIILLEHYGYDDCMAWLTSDVVRSIEIVVKHLSTVDMYIELSKSCGDTLANFTPVFNSNCGFRNLRFSGKFTIKNGMTNINFLLESVRDYDLIEYWPKKVLEQISLYTHNHWRKDFMVCPTLVLLTESFESAMSALDTAHRRLTGINILAAIDGDMQAGGEQMKYYKYVPANEEEGTPATIEIVDAKILKGCK